MSVREKNSWPLRRLVLGARQTNLEVAASLRAAADASGASGVLTGLWRSLRLRARTERRHDQRREGVDAWARMVAGARCSVQEQRCAGKEGARWRACCAARWPIMMDKAANTSIGGVGLDGHEVCCTFTPAKRAGRGVRAAVSFTW